MFDILKMKGVPEAIGRILRAVKTQEKIILFGDADVDGVASVIILKEGLEILGEPPFSVYFSNIEKDGYGLNQKAVNFLKAQSPALLIVFDCGITNFEGVKLAKKSGFEVIIIEHHEVLDRLPDASIIIDPKQQDDSYPFKEFCTAALVYKLVKALMVKAEKSFAPEKFLELAMLATLADLMPLDQENKKIVEQGLLSLQYTQRQGLKALINLKKIQEFDENTIRQKIMPALTSAGIKGHKSEAYLFLTERSLEKAEKIARILLKKNQLKRNKIKQIFEEAMTQIDDDCPIIFLGSEYWPAIFAGAVASRLCYQYKKPVFIFQKGKNKSRGSVRTTKGFDSVKMMAVCSDLLENYGGHTRASGFGIKNKNLEKFKECLVEQLNEKN